MKPGALPWGSPAPPTCGGDRWGASWDQAWCCLPAAFSSFLVQIPLQAALQVSLTWQNPSPCGIQDQNWVHSSADPTKGTDLDHLGSVSARCSDKHMFPALSGDHSQPSGCAEGEAGAHRAQLQSALDASDSASHGGQGDWLCGLRGSGDGRNGAVWLFSPSAGSCIPGGLPMSRAVCRRGGSVFGLTDRHTPASMNPGSSTVAATLVLTFFLSAVSQAQPKAVGPVPAASLIRGGTASLERGQAWRLSLRLLSLQQGEPACARARPLEVGRRVSYQRWAAHARPLPSHWLPAYSQRCFLVELCPLIL